MGARERVGEKITFEIREEEQRAKNLIETLWKDSGYSENLFEVTKRLEDYAFKKLGVKSRCDRLFQHLEKRYGLGTTKDVRYYLDELMEEKIRIEDEKEFMKF